MPCDHIHPPRKTQNWRTLAGNKIIWEHLDLHGWWVILAINLYSNWADDFYTWGFICAPWIWEDIFALKLWLLGSESECSEGVCLCYDLTLEISQHHVYYPLLDETVTKIQPTSKGWSIHASHYQMSWMSRSHYRRTFCTTFRKHSGSQEVKTMEEIGKVSSMWIIRIPGRKKNKIREAIFKQKWLRIFHKDRLHESPRNHSLYQ